MDAEEHRKAQSKRGGRHERGVSTEAVLILIVILLLIVTFGRQYRPRPGAHDPAAARALSAPPDPQSVPSLTRSPPGATNHKPDSADFDPNNVPFSDAITGDGPERRSVVAALNRLYSTADVDPLISGSRYNWADGVRDVYAERTSHGDIYGLQEYSSSGGPGDVGVTIGPFGLDEYGGLSGSFDDGIPEQWKMPSSPIRWFGPSKRDYVGIEGPTPYSSGLYSLQEGDHDPLVN
jgi:hypothetical protein